MADPRFPDLIPEPIVPTFEGPAPEVSTTGITGTAEVPYEDSFWGTFLRQNSRVYTEGLANFDMLFAGDAPKLDPQQFSERVGGRNLQYAPITEESLLKEIEAYDLNAMQAALEDAGVRRGVAEYAGSILGTVTSPQGIAGTATSTLLSALMAPLAAGTTVLGTVGRTIGVEVLAALPEIGIQAATTPLTGQRTYGTEDLAIDLAATALFATPAAAFSVMRARKTLRDQVAQRAADAAAGRRAAATQPAQVVDDTAEQAARAAQFEAAAQKVRTELSIQGNISQQVDIRRRRAVREAQRIAQVRDPKVDPSTVDPWDAYLGTRARNELKKLNVQKQQLAPDDVAGALRIQTRENEIWLDAISRAEKAQDAIRQRLQIKADTDADRAMRKSLSDLEKAQAAAVRKLTQIQKTVDTAVAREVAARETAKLADEVRQRNYQLFQQQESLVMQSPDGPAIQAIQTRMSAEGIEASLQDIEKLVAEAKSLDYNDVLRAGAKRTVKANKGASYELPPRQMVESYGTKTFTDELQQGEPFGFKFDDPVDALMYAAYKGEPGAIDDLAKLMDQVQGTAPVSAQFRRMQAEEAAQAFGRRVRRHLKTAAQWPGGVARIKATGSADDIISAAVTPEASFVAPMIEPEVLAQGVSPLNRYAQVKELEVLQREIDKMPAELKGSSQYVFDTLFDVASELKRVIVGPVCGFK